MQKIHIVENQDYTSRYPASQECRIEVLTADGRHLVEAASYPKGHRNNPISDEELEQKFRSLAGAELSEAQVGRALKALWSLEEMDDAGEVVDLFDVKSGV